MVKLKPCPFCGGKDSGILTTSYDGYWFAVFCENCMAQIVHIAALEWTDEDWRVKKMKQKN